MNVSLFHEIIISINNDYYLKFDDNSQSSLDRINNDIK